MARVEAVALSDFIHGDVNATEGRVCRHRNGDLLDSGLAGDLERAGLVRIRMTPAQANAPSDPAGKSRDDGQGQPSSVSPPAPASPSTTSGSSKPGGGKRGKTAA